MKIYKRAELVFSCVTIPDEMDFIVEYASKAKHGLIELGAAEGRTSIVLGAIAQDKGLKCLSVDKWEDYPFYKWATNTEGLDVAYIKGDTVESATGCNKGEYDFMFLDANHTYEAVKADFEAWRPKLALPASIVFHDVNSPKWGSAIFFKELCKKYKHKKVGNIGVILLERPKPLAKKKGVK